MLATAGGRAGAGGSGRAGPPAVFFRARIPRPRRTRQKRPVFPFLPPSRAVLSNLTHLSDVIGPRLTGTAAAERANRWALERMQAYGLENVHLEPWTIPEGWERGTVHARLLEPDNGRSLSMASYAWMPGTKGKVEGDVVIIKANSVEELKKYSGKLKNAIVLKGPPTQLRALADMDKGGMFGGGPFGGGKGKGKGKKDGAGE